MSVSVVIPTYNRPVLTQRAVMSAFNAFRGLSQHEVIVVDDGSTDGTVDQVAFEFQREIDEGILRITQNVQNIGVTASKNQGFRIAKNDWVLFLDSDDVLLPGTGNAILSVLRSNRDKPVVFFRCVDEKDDFVGIRFDKEQLLSLDTYLSHTSYGEALTAINRWLVKDVPYEGTLRGYEGLGCCRIIARHGPAVLSTVVARRYDKSGAGRLSRSPAFVRRMPLLARGHIMLIREFGKRMSVGKIASYVTKAVVYTAVGTICRLILRD